MILPLLTRRPMVPTFGWETKFGAICHKNAKVLAQKNNTGYITVLNRLTKLGRLGTAEHPR